MILADDDIRRIAQYFGVSDRRHGFVLMDRSQHRRAAERSDGREFNRRESRGQHTERERIEFRDFRRVYVGYPRETVARVLPKDIGDPKS